MGDVDNGSRVVAVEECAAGSRFESTVRHPAAVLVIEVSALVVLGAAAAAAAGVEESSSAEGHSEID